MKILVVEDEPAIRLILRHKLTQAGYEVVETENGQQAWELFQREQFVMMVTDWNMPEMDGPTLIRHIRAANFATYTYIIFLTALSERHNFQEGGKVGADDYLVKPVDGEELLARISLGERMLRFRAKQSGLLPNLPQ
jgi:DNA-binding response OmpR family regulator